ncbi:MAG: UDP-N-acetylmuramoyl-L-alanine--D-glutamate ligase [Propionibacteriaceae bacterium]|jgi:UDP-N-acetylmuramoylalanine--D-glutamate ligase|nr:UDP-N-acetylmuramoyl-L-alanine--D-glutamate ligase [Propionibacteriaceae bacterium]
MSRLIDRLDATSDWSAVRVVVAGLSVSGFAAADTLLSLGAQVCVIDRLDDGSLADKAKLLEILGADVRLGSDASRVLPKGCQLVVTSPGWSPQSPLLVTAAALGLPIWGEVELAWRLQRQAPIPWLGVTGTDGKTTTVTMLAAMLKAEGLVCSAVGNIGRPILEAWQDELSYDVLAVELSSFQLHWTNSLSLYSAAVINLAPDHLEWYEGQSPSAMAAYTADKAKIYQRVQQACVYNQADPATITMVEQADVIEGARAIGVTTGVPGLSMLGVVDGELVDRAFIEQRRDAALPLARISDLPSDAPHIVEDALMAAALARSFGVSARGVRQGLMSYQLEPHRLSVLASRGGIDWIDDSKATSPHATAAAFSGFQSIIWVAGGESKNADFDPLIAENRHRLKAAILIGCDAAIIEAAVNRQAPDVPVVKISDQSPRQAMAAVVAAAAGMATAGNTVLLSPACASHDMFRDFNDRGDCFATAVADYFEARSS